MIVIKRNLLNINMVDNVGADVQKIPKKMKKYMLRYKC
jgi:uncharacterized protein YnzC (UPF0291/DUF896 family)